MGNLVVNRVGVDGPPQVESEVDRLLCAAHSLDADDVVACDA
jgi:hypothetical protein